MLDVVALGAIAESEDLTAPPREPKLNEIGYVHPLTTEELDAYLHARDRVFAEDYIYPPDPPELDDASAAKLMGELEGLGLKKVFCQAPPEMMMAERRKAFESGELHLYAEEFADLSDGRRVILKDDRGWDHRPVTFHGIVQKVLNGLDLSWDAISILEPDDNGRWMEWVVERLHFLDVDVDPMSVHAAPFQVEFGPRVQRELRQRKSGGQASGLDVVAVGAIVEMEDLASPPRRPKLDINGYVRPPTTEELDAVRPERREGFGWLPTASPHEIMLAQRQKMLELGRLSLYAEEFADLSDGRRLILKDDCGWSSGPVNSWNSANGRELTKTAFLMLNTGDDEVWMEWAVERLRFLGVEIDPVSVHAAPFRIEFGPRVRHELRQRKFDG